MLYAILGRDGPDTLERRRQTRARHLERIHALAEAGRLILAGPLPAIDAPDPGPAGFKGSLIVAEFPSLADAERWAAEDPYVAAGIFSTVEVRPFIKVAP